MGYITVSKKSGLSIKRNLSGIKKIYLYQKKLNLNTVLKTAVLFLLLCTSIPCISQTTDEGTEDTEKPVKNIKKRNPTGFHAGFIMGTYFANSNTASLYDGYGYNLDGKKNDFFNSFMNNKINIQYGGANGQPDYIAQALNVSPGDWSFNEGDMPINLQYNIALMLGLQTRYGLNKRESILLNMNAAQLSINGNFTISTINTTPGIFTQNNIQTFSITGGEQRLIFQLGYQRILGDNDQLNFFIEGGITSTLVKFNKNTITIKSLVIDLTSYYYQPGYPEYRTRGLTGFGFGAFGGLGLNLSMSSKWTMQLVYNPSYETINIGYYSTLSLQNALGLRAYYNL